MTNLPALLDQEYTRRGGTNFYTDLTAEEAKANIKSELHEQLALRAASQINGVSGLCVTKLDVLDGVEVLQIGVGYRIGGESIDILPAGAEMLAQCEPIYEEIPGWKESTVGVKRLEDLPANARAYLQRLEQICAIPVDLISTGPDREETIVRRHPFQSER